ncbi:MAG: ABC transporter substrate-binding protein [Longimicrobiales bacterium]
MQARSAWPKRCDVATLLFVMVLALASGACRDRGGSAGGASGEPQQGGTAVIGMRTDLAGFNSITYSDQYTGELINYALFTPLIQYDADLEPQPYLAESWEMTGDTGIVFRIRQGVNWHDGQPVTARDVKFTFDMAKDPATASLLGSAFLGYVDRAEVVDDYTIRFHFSQPHAQALESFWWAPMPEHLLGDIAPAELRNAEFNRSPVGSGPYRFVEWEANQRITLERNPAFPESMGGPPHLDRIVFRIIPEPSTMLTELVAGNVMVDIPLLPEQSRQIERDESLELFAFPGRTFYYIGWNTRREPFTDPRVRRALTLGMDRQEVIDALLFGHGQTAVGPIPQWSPLFPEDIEPLPYDTAAASALLEQAGWVDRNADGVRENAAGQPLQFTMLSSDNPLSRSVVEVVQAQLREIGVQVEARVLEFQTLLGRHRGRDFDAVFSAWVMDNFQIASAPMSLFHSRFADVEGSANRSSYANPRADDLIERAAASTDAEESRELWAEFLRIMQEEQPFTFMFWFEELAAARISVGGIEMDQRGEFVTLADWWVAGATTEQGVASNE